MYSVYQSPQDLNLSTYGRKEGHYMQHSKTQKQPQRNITIWLHFLRALRCLQLLKT